MPTALGFGPIKDDDELLDRLGSRRSDASDDGLEGLFASWTASIDEDERVGARQVGPLGLRRVGMDEESVTPITQRTRVVRVPRTRAVAIVGALALTLSGGGVAAALTQAQSPIVTNLIQAAASKSGRLVSLAAQPAPTTPTSAPTVQAAWQMVEKARQAADKGEVAKAMGMMEVIRSLAPKDDAGVQITAEVDALERLVTVTPSRTASAPTVVGPVTAAPPVVTSPTATASEKPTSEKPTSTKPSDSGSTTVPGTTRPTQTPVTTVPSVGHSGGNQNAGTGTATAPAVAESKPPTSDATQAKPTADAPERGESNGTAAAPDLGHATESGSGQVADTSSEPTESEDSADQE